MTNPRDPRLRRRSDARPDPIAAAVALEVAADRMRAGLHSPEPEPADIAYAPAVVEQLEQWDQAARWAPPETVTDSMLRAAAKAAAAAPRLADLERGSYPDMTGGLSALDYLDDIRGEAATEQGDDPEPSVFVAGGQVPEPPAPSLTLAAPAPEPVTSTDAPGVFENEQPPVRWRSRHDHRSRAFGVADRLPGRGPLQAVRLPTGPVLDQTQAGATLAEQSCCTGCGIVAAHNALWAAHPFGEGVTYGLDEAERIYERAKVLDAVPGEEYAGTSVLAALQAAVDLKVIGGYLWCFGTRDIAQTLIVRRAPVVIGIPWLSGMWQTGPGGLVEPSGHDTGLGHVLTIVGLELTGPQGQPGPYFVWQNSAGESYGDGGFGRIHHRHLAQLLAGIGEAAVPTLDPQAPQ